MSTLKEMIKEEPVRGRRLEFKTHPVEKRRVIVEGWFHDELLAPGYHWDGRPRASGVVHRMCVRMLVGGAPLRILDAEAEMPHVPFDQCLDALESVKRIVGASIVAGYGDEVKKRMGGVRGCAHLAHLVTAMGPAALHGYWSHRARRPRPRSDAAKDLRGLTQIINTCQIWKEDGPRVRAFREMLSAAQKET
ncbi:MAG: DUF2889 domain-containing protein [Desulfobacterales bacterium]|nr:DUF2889 domain-containing protein [Desulfobacterales bacterium]